MVWQLVRAQAPIGVYFDDEFLMRERAYQRFAALLMRQQREFLVQVNRTLAHMGEERSREGYDAAIADVTANQGAVDWRLELIVDHIMYSPQRAYYVGDVATWCHELDKLYSTDVDKSVSVDRPLAIGESMPWIRWLTSMDHFDANRPLASLHERPWSELYRRFLTSPRHAERVGTERYCERMRDWCEVFHGTQAGHFLFHPRKQEPELTA